MVNLRDQPAKQAGQSALETALRNSRRWRYRYGGHCEELRVLEITSLHQLEDLAWRSVDVMERYEFNRTQKTSANYDRAMELLRLQYNMNFLVLCEQCGGKHNNHDEITAPER